MITSDEHIPYIPRSIVTALKTGARWAAIATVVLYAAVGTRAAIDGGMKSIANIFHKPVMKSIFRDSAIWGMVGALVGFVRGERKNAEYPLEVENTTLRQALDLELKRDKSFTQQVTDERLQRTVQPASRS